MIQYTDNTRDISYPEIQTAYPVYNKVSPQQSDYESGYIDRYFVKRANDVSIYETSKDNYFDISSRLYIKIVIKWKLTGKRNDIYQNGIKTYEGVYEYNKNQINIYKKVVIGLENILRDPLEFWKPS